MAGRPCLRLLHPGCQLGVFELRFLSQARSQTGGSKRELMPPLQGACNVLSVDSYAASKTRMHSHFAPVKE